MGIAPKREASGSLRRIDRRIRRANREHRAIPRKRATSRKRTTRRKKPFDAEWLRRELGAEAQMAVRETDVTESRNETNQALSGPSSGRLLQLVSFRLGSEEYGLEILRVQEIMRMLGITRVPNSRSSSKALSICAGK